MFFKITSLKSWISHYTMRCSQKNCWAHCCVSLDLHVSSNMHILMATELQLTQIKHTHIAPVTNRCTHSQHDRIVGVCLVREAKWAEIRSCDASVCLHLYHSNLTAVILFKQRQMASGKVRKSLSPSFFLISLSIYVPISASSLFVSFRAFSADWILKKVSKSYSIHYTHWEGDLLDCFTAQSRYQVLFFQDQTEMRKCSIIINKVLKPKKKKKVWLSYDPTTDMVALFVTFWQLKLIKMPSWLKETNAD